MVVATGTRECQAQQLPANDVNLTVDDLRHGKIASDLLPHRQRIPVRIEGDLRDVRIAPIVGLDRLRCLPYPIE